MNRRIFFTILVFVFILTAKAAHAEIGETLSLVTEGVIELPMSLMKIVGGTLKLVGELLILPFKFAQGGA